jgi:polar amino acid transport system substrate-binding protein
MVGSSRTWEVSRNALAGCAALLLLSAAVSAPIAAAASGPARLRVGISTDYAPIAFKEGGEIKGVEADFAHQLTADYGTAIELVETSWNELIPALQENKIDVIMSGMSVTADRKAKVDFVQPYKRVGQMVLIRKADITRLSEPAAMTAKGARVGVETYTTGEAYARGHLPKAAITAFATVEEGIAALRKGEIDFFVHDAPTIWRVVGRPATEDPDLTGLYRPLTDEGLAWAVRKGDAKTRKFLDAALARWRKDGTLQSIVDRWVPVKKIAVKVKH